MPSAGSTICLDDLSAYHGDRTAIEAASVKTKTRLKKSLALDLSQPLRRITEAIQLQAELVHE